MGDMEPDNRISAGRGPDEMQEEPIFPEDVRDDDENAEDGLDNQHE
jgi:hypothetical protein